MTVSLKSPRLRVVLGDPEDASSWDEHTIRVIGRDMQATEELLRQLKRGSLGENPITGQAMFAYFALRRTGAIPPGTTWADFQNTYLEVTEAESAEQVGPTSPAPGTEPL